MATHTLSDDLGDLVGAPLTFPDARPARAYLSPTRPYTTEGDELRVGGVELDLDQDGVFSQPNIPSGQYLAIVNYYNPATGRSARWVQPRTIPPETTLAP